MENWTTKNAGYESFVGGNSWVNFWLTRTDEYFATDYILYTLQPDSLTLDELFPKELIEFIKADEHKWFVRLHPRQIAKRAEIESFLEKNGILELVNIENATADPLPVLLKNCFMHVTNSSASTIEASFFDKKTVLLHEIGNLYYPELISQGDAFYLKPGSGFKDKFNEILKSISRGNGRRITGVNEFQKNYFKKALQSANS